MSGKVKRSWPLMVILVGVVPAIMMRAYVLSKLWLWHAEPIGLPHVDRWHLWGLGVALWMVTYKNDPRKTDDDEDPKIAAVVGRAIGQGIAQPLIFLALGWFAAWMARP